MGGGGGVASLEMVKKIVKEDSSIAQKTKVTD